MKNRALLKKADFLIIAIICVFALIMYLGYNYYAKNENATRIAEIQYDGEVIKRVSLEQDCAFSVKENENVKFEIKNGEIAFISSDCPDKVCVKTGWIGHNGEMAVCLPNRLSIKIIAEDDTDIII